MRITAISKPIERERVWTDRPPTSVEVAARAAKVADYDRRREAWRAQNPDILARDDEDGFFSNAYFGAVYDAEETQKAAPVAVAFTQPVWFHRLEQWLIWGDRGQEDGVLRQMDTAARIKVPLALGVVDAEITFESYQREWRNALDEVTVEAFLVSKFPVRIISNGMTFAHGYIEDHHACEMCVWHVVLIGQQHQATADALAKVLDAINADSSFPETLPAYLPNAKRCFHCNRPLTDQVSRTLGLGPDCADKLGVAHSEAAAEMILKIAPHKR